MSGDTPPAPDPAVLIERARGGSPTALGTLLESYSRYLTLLARVQIGRRLQGKVDPGDLVQETFLEAHRQFGRFRGASEAEFRNWLRTILTGQMVDVLRRHFGTKGRDLKMEREVAARTDQSFQALDGGFVASTSTPSQRASRREQAVILADALAKLPDDYRDVIVLRQVEGLGFAEVAQQMGRSEDSVQKLWVRALTRLRRAIGGD